MDVGIFERGVIFFFVTKVIQDFGVIEVIVIKDLLRDLMEWPMLPEGTLTGLQSIVLNSGSHGQESRLALL